MGKVGKAKGFQLKHHEPFIFYGDNGEYTIPPLEKTAYEDWKEVGDALANNAGTKQQITAYKAFFLRVCPELENEAIGDNQWLQFGSAYFTEMGE